MSDLIPKAPGLKIGGLGRQAQKLQAMKEKAAGKTGAKAAPGNGAAPKARELAGTRKTTFQRKAV